MITIVLAGRNDDYGGNFRERLFRTTLHNSSLLSERGVDYEYLFAEWNPLPDRPLVSEEFVRRIPNSSAIIIPPGMHQSYSLNSNMPFHEMAAKNAALRRAKGERVIVTNADILFSEQLADRIAAANLRTDTLYRAHRIDVAPQLTPDEMRNPANQLASGEGSLAPCYYLGAGGDFCLASKQAWSSLRGFNERVRFSTRAKDWQFFLNAAARGFRTEFIGDCYHLDHKEGFRNTPRHDTSTGSGHFGPAWDIEFGLPFGNPDDWGFGDLATVPVNGNPSLLLLDESNFAIPQARGICDLQLSTMLTRPPSVPDYASARMYHAICAAHRQRRRLVFNIQDARSAVALAGLNAVASLYDVDVLCAWRWPEMEGFHLRPFREPHHLKSSDWLLLEGFEHEAEPAGVAPTRHRILKPEFDPLLVRRLCRACLRMQAGGIRRIALYGAGLHTQKLLNWGIPDSIEVAAIVTTAGPADFQWGLPVVPLADSSGLDIDAILLSSSSFEQDMMHEAQRRGISTVIPLYSDWPQDLWRNGPPNA